MAKIARDRLSEKAKKIGGNVGNNQNLPYKYHTSTIQVPYKCPITLKQVVKINPKAANKNTASPNWGAFFGLWGRGRKRVIKQKPPIPCKHHTRTVQVPYKCLKW